MSLNESQIQEVVRQTVAELLRQQQGGTLAPPAQAAPLPFVAPIPPAASARSAAQAPHVRSCIPTIILWDTVTCPPNGVGVHEIAQRLRQLTSRLLTPQATPQAPVASVISFVAFVERASTLSSDALAVLQECGIEPTMVIPLTNKPCWELTMRTRVLQFMLEHGDGGFAVIVTNRTIQTIADLLTLRHQFRVHVVNHRLWTSQVLSLAVAIAPRQASVKTPAVGVFWDIENIGRTDRAVEIIRDIQLEFGPVTRAIAAAASIDPSFASGNLIKAGVTLMNEWNGQPRQEVADEVLIHQMFHFCETTPPPATIVLISNDQDFIRPCSVLFNRGYVVIRIVCPNPNWPARQWRIVDYFRISTC